MATRALLQRISKRGALRISPGASVPLTLYLSSNFSTRGIRNNSDNGIFYNTNINNVSSIKNQKAFSTSSERTKELATMSEPEVSGLRVQEERLMKDLHETCEWGKGEVWGR